MDCLFRRALSSVLAFIALLAASGLASAAVTATTLPADARAGDYVTVQIEGTLPREDFWITDVILTDLTLVEQSGSNGLYKATIDLYYHWAPLYVSPLKRTPFTASVGLGQFPTAANVDITVRFFPQYGLPGVVEVEDFAFTSVRIGSGTASCGQNEIVLGGASASCTPNLRFGTYRPETRSDEVTLTIRNRGRDPFYLGAMTINNADYGVTRLCGETVEPNGSCDVRITFAPSINGTSPGRLTVLYSTVKEAKPFDVAFATFSGDSVAAPIVAPTSGLRVVEFYAASIDQYFLAADEKEMALLDGSRDWRRTGVTFIATGEFAACRFVGDEAAGPHGGHYYVAKLDECNALRAQDILTPRGRTGYRYEGVAFTIGLPQLSMYDGRYRCPEGSRALYQVKREAGSGRDVAYRFIPAGSVSGGPNGDDLLRTLLGAGWAYQGHAMCSVVLPPADPG